jgi:hypothetical protein
LYVYRKYINKIKGKKVGYILKEKIEMLFKIKNQKNLKDDTDAGNFNAYRAEYNTYYKFKNFKENFGKIIIKI